MGPLHGVVLAIKDQYDTFDMRTTSGADAPYANDRPPQDATFVKRLREAGAIIIAKANMGEYASGDRSSFGGTFCNPYDTERSPGRSSGGSGSAVAANLVTCAIGEESGPSIRNPAKNNNIVGLAPTQELVYLQQRGDANIRTTRDLVEKSRFYVDVREDSGFNDKRQGLQKKLDDQTLDLGERLQTRFVMQQVGLQCLALQHLDAVVYPTGNIPPPKLGAPTEPTVNGRSAMAWTAFGAHGFPAISVPGGFTANVYDREKNSSGGTKLAGPVPARLPVGVDFLGGPFAEPRLLRIAAAYEAATRHRSPPSDFGPVPGEP